MADLYDTAFNKNEWTIIVFLFVGLILMVKLKKIFSFKQTIVYFLFGFFTGILCDHILSTPPIDLYDVGDNSSYEIMDFITYLMFSPFSYIFVYVYKRANIKLKYTPIYILLYSIIATLSELLADFLGVFHYKNGYTLYNSFPTYLLVFTCEIYLYKFLSSGPKEST
ncbi:hypothetical protein NBE98_06255 [Clostridium swellfunianum]|uniref:CBO0543 family protein n=1 Tax=Clostridium swellfunianum TaxID=1367462 RepID=UPI0020306FDF|nr:CBO0543 family protein [Clostridium swellfunianum]MCM0647974.1 hypothetical protein [Clostridium swellfunianum]